jgi:hypothetical protein
VSNTTQFITVHAANPETGMTVVSRIEVNEHGEAALVAAQSFYIAEDTVLDILRTAGMVALKLEEVFPQPSKGE